MKGRGEGRRAGLGQAARGHAGMAQTSAQVVAYVSDVSHLGERWDVDN